MSAAQVNAIVISGRTGSDPEIRYFESGAVKSRLTVAVRNAYAKNPDGSSATDWFDVEVWGQTAEFSANHITKGSIISVEGELKREDWEDRTTNEKRHKYLIKADKITLLLKGGSASTAESEEDSY